MRVEFGDLHSLSNLAPRGQTAAVEIVTTRGGCTHLFKRYKDETRTHMQPRVLLELADWRTKLSSSDRAWLDQQGAWIRHVVYDHGDIVGVLIPIASPDCWTMKQDRSVPRDGSRLVAKSAKYEYFNLPHRTHLMGELLQAILWFHQRGVVLGDIQLSNFLVEGDKGVFLIDLDSAWVNGSCAFPLTENPRYAAPFDTGLQTERTDLYKFALVASKVLALDGAARTASLGAHAMAAYQHDILNNLLVGKEEDLSTLSSLAHTWSKCVGERGEFHFVPDATNRIESIEAPGRLIRGIPPAADRCATPAGGTIMPSPSAANFAASTNAAHAVGNESHTGILVLFGLLAVFAVILVYLIFFR